MTSAPLLARGAGAIRSLGRLRCEVAGPVEDEIGGSPGARHVGGAEGALEDRATVTPLATISPLTKLIVELVGFAIGSGPR